MAKRKADESVSPLAKLLACEEGELSPHGSPCAKDPRKPLSLLVKCTSTSTPADAAECARRHLAAEMLDRDIDFAIFCITVVTELNGTRYTDFTVFQRVNEMITLLERQYAAGATFIRVAALNAETWFADLFAFLSADNLTAPHHWYLEMQEKACAIIARTMDDRIPGEILYDRIVADMKRHALQLLAVREDPEGKVIFWAKRT